MKLHSIPLAALVLVAACSPAGGDMTTPPTETTPPTTVELPDTEAPTGSTSRSETATTADLNLTRGVAFTDGLTLDVLAPVGTGPWPTVVFFHGGTWYGGAKENVEKFAAALAEAGAVVYNATYRIGREGGGYPQSYQDVGCAIAFAASTTSDYGGDPNRVVVAGHSAGAHLAATVLLGGEVFAGDQCTVQGPIAADGLIGIAGPYDVSSFAPLLAPWFGGPITEIPEVFDAGDPYGYLDTDPIPVLLVHGTADELVPLSFTTDFEEALSGEGWTVDTSIIEAGTHTGVIDPEFSAGETVDAITEFLGGLG